MKNALIALTALLILTAAQASASTITLWQATPHPNEVSLNEILDDRYGAGGWFQKFDPSTFPQQLEFVEQIASYAGASQEFNWQPAVSGGWTACDNVTDYLGRPYVGMVCSDATRNPNGETHVLAFGVRSQPGLIVLAFEDTVGVIPVNDRDFNDLVVSVGAVPEPGTIVLLGAGLLAVATLRRRRRS